jgi:superfamily I DNA/RNA helicase
MAVIFPNAPVGILPKETLRAFHFLKSLPDPYVVWHHLAPWQSDAPDFLILNPEGQALLVKVSPTTSKEVRSPLQMLLIESEAPPLGGEAHQVLDAFLRSLQNGQANLHQKIPGVILFPNLSERQLRRAKDHQEDAKFVWIGQEYLKRDSNQKWERIFIQESLDQEQIRYLRALFTPEVVVPPSLTVCKAPERHLEASITDFLLDYDQEKALKTDLDLSADGASLVNDFRLNLVNGVAGSGKTLILLYRLRLLNELFPDKNMLVLTHNRPLIRDMESRYYRLTGGSAENIAWFTFQQWCRQHWPNEPVWVKPLSIPERRNLIESIKQKHLPDNWISMDMFQSELDWIKDQAITEPQAYWDADRKGRGFSLTQAQRQQVFAAVGEYDQELARRQRTDWATIPLQIRAFIQEGRLEPPQYDVILVDEAQFFAPVWFEIVQSLVKPQIGHLFLAADPTQGFLRQGVSWKSLGLEVRGRSHHLKHSYRTTLEILNFATLFYRNRVQAEASDAEIIAPDLFNMPSGATPVLLPLTSYQDEIVRVVSEIVALLKRGTPRNDILVLHANGQGVSDLIKAIDRRLGRGVALNPKYSHPGNYIRVTTVNAGTGLEAPIVFLVGLRQLFEEEQSLRLSDEDREALILANTRKIYMAATRAGQRLVFTYVGKMPEVVKALFNPATDRPALVS